MMELELLILEFWSFKTAYVDKFSTWNRVEVEFIILDYKLELQKLYFSTIKISKFQTLSNMFSKTQNTHSDTHSNKKHSSTRTLLLQTPKPSLYQRCSSHRWPENP